LDNNLGNWRATVGVVNSIALLLRTRPFLFLEPCPTQNASELKLQLRIINPGDHPMQISRLRLLRERGDKLKILSAESPQTVRGSFEAAHRWQNFR
jgi:hypothetical protein